jgi:hypothetical protein
MTMGELALAAKAAAPGSLKIDGYIITHIADIPYFDGPHALRWCFTCRATTEHSTVTSAPVGESIDTPLVEVHCLSCGGKDTDLFPGKEREDDQPE